MAELKPGEFLITREQHYRRVRLDYGQGLPPIDGASVLSDRPLDDPAILALRKPTAAVKRYLDHEAEEACRRAGLGPTDCRGEPLDLGPDLRPYPGHDPYEVGPATSADLLDLDAVPEPTDSDALREVHQAGACPGRGKLHPRDGDRGPEYACAACFWQGA